MDTTTPSPDDNNPYITALNTMLATSQDDGSTSFPNDDPTKDYGSVLPFATNKTTGAAEFAAPEMIRAPLRGMMNRGQDLMGVGKPALQTEGATTGDDMAGLITALTAGGSAGAAGAGDATLGAGPFMRLTPEGVANAKQLLNSRAAMSALVRSAPTMSERLTMPSVLRDLVANSRDIPARDFPRHIALDEDVFPTETYYTGNEIAPPDGRDLGLPNRVVLEGQPMNNWGLLTDEGRQAIQDFGDNQGTGEYQIGDHYNEQGHGRLPVWFENKRDAALAKLFLSGNPGGE